MKKLVLSLVLLALLPALALAVPKYQIKLTWDDMAGECNGLLSGFIGDQYGYVDGAGKSSAMNGKLTSSGEVGSFEGSQTFDINSDQGYFSFWIRDKFVDDDIYANPYLIAKAKPIIQIFRNNSLLKMIKIEDGYGLTCKVFTLDVTAGEITVEKRFFPRTKVVLAMVVDAVTGDPVPNAEVYLTGGEEHPQQCKTDTDGTVWFTCEIGNYRLDINKPGYVSNAFPVKMGFDENPIQYVVALCPEVKEFRIVLTWGANPRDLDAHLAGPRPEGGNFHIWYRNRVLIGGKDFLDRDDVDSYGPETITIYKPAVGDYLYSVHDYTNRSNPVSKALSRCGATVQVYADKQLKATYTVPPELNGNLWKVFKIDKNLNIIPINSISWIENEANIQ